MRLQNNLMAMNAQKGYRAANTGKLKSLGKLSSGYRINSAADDTAGVSISQKMHAQIRGLNQADDNVQAGVTLIDVADGALAQCNEIVQRMRELAVQSSNDTNNNSVDREALNREYQQLKFELNEIAETTMYNNKKILDGSIARLRFTGYEMDISGVYEYGTQIMPKTIVSGPNTTTAKYPADVTYSHSSNSAVSVAAPQNPGTVISASGSVTDNGESLEYVLNLGPDVANAEKQGRADAAIAGIETNGSLTVDNNDYTGYVYSNNESHDIEVKNNYGFISSNSDNTIIGTNNHTGQVLINNNVDAIVEIGSNNGGEIQVGTIDTLKVDDNKIYTKSSDSSDYTYTITYHFTDGTTLTESTFSDSNNRINSYSEPQFDGNSIPDYSLGILQSDGTYLREETTTGYHSIGKYYNKVTYIYTLTNQPAGNLEYDGPRIAENGYNYAYNTYWDEIETGRISSGAVNNVVDNNSGIIHMTNTAANSKSTIEYNSGTIGTNNVDVDVEKNYGDLFSINNSTGTTFDLNDVNGSGGRIYTNNHKVTINNNKGLIHSYNELQNDSTFDLTGTNEGILHLYNEISTVNDNDYRVIAYSKVGKLTVNENNYTGSISSSWLTPNIDGQHIVSEYDANDFGLTSYASETVITKNTGSAAIVQGKLTVTDNSGYIDVNTGTQVDNIAKNTGTVVLRKDSNVTGWATSGISNDGTIIIHEEIVPNPVTISSNNSTGMVKAVNGANIIISDNDGDLEISGGRLGLNDSKVVIDDNSGDIRNGGELTINVNNDGVIDNYSIVIDGSTDGSVFANSNTIRHHASNFDTTGVNFVTDSDIENLTDDEIDSLVTSIKSEIKFDANGQTFTISAYWQRIDYSVDNRCNCGEICTCGSKDRILSSDRYELLFDLSDISLESSEGLFPADFDGGFVVFGEDSLIPVDGLRCEIQDTIPVNGERGSVGTKLAFYMSVDIIVKENYENNNGLHIQSGANAHQSTFVYIENMSTEELGNCGCFSCDRHTLSTTDIISRDSSQRAINICSTAIDQISRNRSSIGVMRNRFDFISRTLNVSSDNTQDTESRIRDVDYAKEMSLFMKNDIISQSAVMLTSHANTNPEAVLKLLG